MGSWHPKLETARTQAKKQQKDLAASPKPEPPPLLPPPPQENELIRILNPKPSTLNP